MTATLVFSDELHREAWLVQAGFVPPRDTEAQPHTRDVLSPPPQPETAAERVLAHVRATTRARRLDYDRRRASQNLTYTVGPLFIRHSSGFDEEEEEPEGKLSDLAGAPV